MRYKAKVLVKKSDSDYGYQANAGGNSIKALKEDARRAARMQNLRAKRIYLQFDEHPKDEMVNQTIAVNM